MSNYNRNPQQKGRPTEEEIDRVVNQATGTLRDYFVNKDINNDRNWSRLHDKQVDERTRTVTVNNKLPPVPSTAAATNSSSSSSGASRLPPPPPKSAVAASASKNSAANSSGMNNMEALAEIEKMARLRDLGILTEYEFQTKKKQLLGL